MKLISFDYQGKTSWGFVLADPFDGSEWVYEPAKVDMELRRSATGTNGYNVSMGSFLPGITWPESMVSFLELEDKGMEALEKLVRFTKRFLEQSDNARLAHTGHPLSEVELRAPIPCPRLYWGLVQNCPTFARSNPSRTTMNLFPMGHQRPAGAVIGANQIFYEPANAGGYGYNVELGVVIGKKGRYIPVNEALNYVAGYTIVTDSQVNGFYPKFGDGSLGGYAIAEVFDWYVDATCSWGGKMGDAHCAMGPYITTKDEIGNIYDLIAATKMDGRMRDRTHTAALLLGIERTIQWYSSFATLYPGDVIHMGTMGTDGLSVPAEYGFNGPDCRIESSIEQMGTLSNPVLDMNHGDWRADDDPSKTIHISPAVRDVIKEGKDTIASPDDWNLKNARHFFTLFKNFRAVEETEGNKLSKAPRFLGAPNSALGLTGSTVELPPRAADLDISVELAFVMKKIASKVDKAETDDYVLGYLPLISITDSSFGDHLVEPATRQEKGLPLVYGRWADGFNSITEKPVSLSWQEVCGRKMTLSVEGIGEVEGSTDEYYSVPEDIVPFITEYVTLFPGDVLTLGHIKNRIKLKKDQIADGMKVKASVEGIGDVEITLKHSDSGSNDNAFNGLKL